jgi:hypothetical protein
VPAEPLLGTDPGDHGDGPLVRRADGRAADRDTVEVRDLEVVAAGPLLDVGARERMGGDDQVVDLPPVLAEPSGAVRPDSPEFKVGHRARLVR